MGEPSPPSLSSPKTPQTESSTTSITDLNTDTLVHCACYLDNVRDIVYMAMSSKYLKQAAYADCVWQSFYRSLRLEDSSAARRIMSSSVQASSDNNNNVVQQNDTGAQIRSSTRATEVSSPVIAAPNMQYAPRPQIGAGAASTLAPAAYPYPDPYYRSIFSSTDAQPYPVPPYPAQPYPAQTYPAQPMVQVQLMGIQQAGLPLPSDTVEEPVFVNAKQYHGILRRRRSRAKAESEKKIAKSKKPYLHESRHQHALRRARGTGGRFLNSKNNENQQKEAGSGDKSKANSSYNSGRSSYH